MTVRQAYQDTIRLLREGQVEEPDSQAHWLFSHFFGLSRPQRALHASDLLSDEKLRLLRQAITRRIAGEPLQYILGEWTFMDIPLKVGPGVLIPRDDTEVCAPALCPGAYWTFAPAAGRSLWRWLIGIQRQK